MNSNGSSSAQTAVSAVQLSKGSVYRLPSNAVIGSVTVDASQFVGSLTVYNGTQASNPMFQVSSGQVKTMPVGAARNLFLQSAVQGTGLIYLQFTDQFLSSTTNLSQIAPIASQSWTLVGQGLVKIASAPSGVISDPNWGNLAWFQLTGVSPTNLSLANGKGTSPTVYIQSLEVSGLPPYVTSGIDIQSSGTQPGGFAPLLLGSGRLAPAVPIKYGSLGGVNPIAWAVFGNYDSTAQIFNLSLNWTLTGYST